MNAALIGMNIWSTHLSLSPVLFLNHSAGPLKESLIGNGLTALSLGNTTLPKLTP
jgi:hypothetical protein